MKFIFYSPVHFEKWCWLNSIEKGIGGSETSHVEMAWRLAARGHEVITYAPIPDDCPQINGVSEWRNTKWFPLEVANFNQHADVWVLYRCPDILDKFQHSCSNESKKWLIMQDWDYNTFTKERIDKIDKIVPLCKSHANYLLQRHPEWNKDKIWITSNGIKLDLIRETETNLAINRLAEGWRNQKKIIYASSPDRGLMPLLKIFKRAKEYDPSLELHVFYGFDNISKLKQYNKLVDQIKKEIDKVGAIARGRVSQNDLYKEWFSSAIWIYCTTFWETSCITCQEAQAMGAIPIFSPIWAQAENIKHGVAIPGHPDNALTLARYVDALVTIANDIKGQESIRPEMMSWARERFNWENFVTQWIEAAKGNYYNSFDIKL